MSVSAEPGRFEVLIVEDEAMIALMLEDAVTALGHQVCGIAATLKDALRHVANGGFDLAIVDCHLKGEDAWPVVDMLAQADIPFILSSGGLPEDMPALYRDRPMLSKPYNAAAIADVLAVCKGGSPASYKKNVPPLFSVNK